MFLGMNNLYEEQTGCILENNIQYYYIDQPIVIIKYFWQIHMAKVRYIGTQKEFIIDISVISKEPSKDISISINWLRRNIE